MRVVLVSLFFIGVLGLFIFSNFVMTGNLIELEDGKVFYLTSKIPMKIVSFEGVEYKLSVDKIDVLGKGDGYIYIKMDGVDLGSKRKGEKISILGGDIEIISVYHSVIQDVDAVKLNFIKSKVVLVEETPCIDSDGGKNYGEKGEIRGVNPTGYESPNGWRDRCSGKTFLLEYFCNQDGKVEYESIRCSGEAGCQDGRCVSLSEKLISLSENNDLGRDRVNVVFVPVNFLEGDDEYFKKVALTLIDFDAVRGSDVFSRGITGIMTLEPYKSNPEKFNWWVYDEFFQIDVSQINYDPISQPREFGVEYNSLLGDMEYSLSSNLTLEIPNLVVAYIHFTEYPNTWRSGGQNRYPDLKYFKLGLQGVYGYDLYKNIINTRGHFSNEESVFSHEFQHEFADLRDEYVYSSLREFPDIKNYPPNCVKMDDAVELWGDLVGQGGPGVFEIGYYPGCMGATNRYSPTKCGLMNPCMLSDLSQSELDYYYSDQALGLANIRFVQQELDKYTNELLI